MLIYLSRQLGGQLRIVWGAGPVEAVLHDTAYSQQTRARLALIQDVRQYGTDSLGLENTKNYTTFYDTQGKDVLWVVEAAEQFALQAYEWHFPVMGKFSYKGYFRKDLAQGEKARVEALGYDASLRNVEAWSTLGYFRDPILSPVLSRNEGRLAELILHELFHATVFVRNDMELNENLATFVGQEGAKDFLDTYYGKKSEQKKAYLAWLEDKAHYREHFRRGALALQQLYQHMPDSLPESEKLLRKYRTLRQIQQSTDTIAFHHKKLKKALLEEEINNAWLMRFLKYHRNQDALKRKFRDEFKANLPELIKHLKENY